MPTDDDAHPLERSPRMTGVASATPLLKGEGLYRILSEMTPALLWIAGADTQAIYFNPAWSAFTGRALAQDIGSGWMALVHPEDLEHAVKVYRSAVFKQTDHTVEYRLRRHDGEYRWILSSAVPYHGAEGRYLGLVGCCTDITELRHARDNEAQIRERFELAVAGSLDGIWDWPDVTTPAMWWSPRCFELGGYAEHEVPQTFSGLLELVHPDDKAGIVALVEATLRDGSPFNHELRVRIKSGQYCWFRVRGIAVVDATGRPRRLAGSFTDIDAQRRFETELKTVQERFELAVAGSTSGLWDWEREPDRVWYAPSFMSLLGYGRDEKIASGLAGLNDLIHPDDRERNREIAERHFKHLGPYDIEARLRHRSGEYRWYHSRGQAQWNAQGVVVRMSGSIQDIHQRKMTEQALYEEKEKALVTLSSIGDAVITTDASGRIEFLNPVAEKLTGSLLAQTHGQPLGEVFHIQHHLTGRRLVNPILQSIEQGLVTAAADAVLVASDAAEYSIEYSAAPIRSAEGKVFGAVLVFRDVTAARRMAQEVSYQATHDALTGLANRREFERRLGRVISSAINAGDQHALCYLDLDQFKVINDTCGHQAGDELLRQISSLLRSNVRARDTVARLGGDEFGVLMEHCSQTQASRVSEVLRARVSDYRFVWEDHTFAVGVSIGLVPITESSENIANVLKQADVACYTAKDQGRNRVHLYRPDDEELQRRRGEMRWISKINAALDKNQFVLYGQPARALQAGENDCYIEILIRYQEGDELLGPTAFLPAAERYGLSVKIDQWVIENVCNWYERQRPPLDSNVLLAINLSALSLCDDEFEEFIHRQLAAARIPCESVCFEITETAAISNLTKAIKLFNSLRARGCRFALDDFGSGLSSFGYLRSLPIDFLKIDGLFVRDALDDPIDFAMVKSIHEIGHVMGKQTIAKFVENDRIALMLREIGVNYAQGHGICRPLPLDEVVKWLARCS